MYNNKSRQIINEIQEIFRIRHSAYLLSLLQSFLIGFEEIPSYSTPGDYDSALLYLR